MLELARLEEYLGNVPAARAILTEARVKARGDWKVFLEGVLFERRNGKREDAVRDCLRIHVGVTCGEHNCGIQFPRRRV